MNHFCLSSLWQMHQMWLLWCWFYFDDFSPWSTWEMLHVQLISIYVSSAHYLFKLMVYFLMCFIMRPISTFYYFMCVINYLSCTQSLHRPHQSMCGFLKGCQPLWFSRNAPFLSRMRWLSLSFPVIFIAFRRPCA